MDISGDAPRTAGTTSGRPPLADDPTVPTVHDEIAQARKDHPARKGMPFNVLVTLVEIGGSIGLFHLAKGLGASDVVSYLVGSIGPVVGGLLIWIKARKFSGASASIFAFTAISAIIALIGSTDSKVLLYKDCATTALIGLIFLASCVLARKPLVFYMAQRYGTDGTHDGMATYDKMWITYQDFRTAIYVISYWWAALFLIQAAATALIIHQTTFSTAYNYDQILPLVATGLGILVSIALGRYFARKGQASHATATADHPAHA
ncbi:MAG: hypothetical protein JO287_10545 [Pseudonocardiales bacterium]|nr:hypothetical protein [Pseudonocardiales bacterium]